MKSRYWPGLQSHLRFGVFYQATVGRIQLLVVVGLKSHFLSGVSKFLDAGQVLTIQTSHNMASKSAWESLHFIKTVSYVMQHKHGSDSPSYSQIPSTLKGWLFRACTLGVGILGAILRFWTLLKNHGSKMDMIFQTVIFMWVFFFF